MKQMFFGALTVVAMVAPAAAIIVFWPARPPSADHRQVLRVCPGGVLIVRDGPSLQVIRPRTLKGWDVAPDATPESLCPVSIGLQP